MESLFQTETAALAETEVKKVDEDPLQVVGAERIDYDELALIKEEIGKENCFLEPKVEIVEG